MCAQSNTEIAMSKKLTVGFAVGEVDGLDEGWEVQEEE